MDKETTKILGAEQETPKNKVQTTLSKSEETLVSKKKRSVADFAAQTTATAMGAAVGTGAAMMVNNLYAASVEDNDVLLEENVSEEIDAQDPTNSDSLLAEGNNEVIPTVDDSLSSSVNAAPEHASYINDETSEPMQAVEASDSDEVHVVGVAVQSNGMGGTATMAHLQSATDEALLVDVESDGKLDYIVHDDNKDGKIDMNEWHDISKENIDTAQVVGTYVQEAQEQGATAVVTNLDSGESRQIVETDSGYGITTSADSPMEDNLQMASQDELPDYVNNADAGVMDL